MEQLEQENCCACVPLLEVLRGKLQDPPSAKLHKFDECPG